MNIKNNDNDGKPNVIILMVDQMNYKCLGYKGHPVVKTPNLDRLREDSVEFSKCYVQNAFCLPSRTCYFTSQYLFHHRQYGFHGLQDENSPCMPAFFAQNGYYTFHCGKSHLGSMNDILGFKTFIPTLPEDMAFATNPDLCYQVYCERKGYGFPTDQVHGVDNAPPAKKSAVTHKMSYSVGTSSIPAEDSQEAYTADMAIDFINKKKDNTPFFMHVSFDRPHSPVTPSEPYDSMYDPDDIPIESGYTEEQLKKLPVHIRRFFENGDESIRNTGKRNMKGILSQYYGLITHIDHEIGKIINSLKECGLYDNTIIMFYADHGDMAGYNGLFNKYANQIYHDNIIRTPMLLKFPVQQNAGSEVGSIVESIDVFPTLAHLCGLDYSGLQIDGRNLTEYLVTGKKAERDDRVAISEAYGLRAVIKGDWKLIYYVNSNEGELYNLNDDPGESDNLFGMPGYEEKTTELKLALIEKLTKPVSERRQAYIRSLFDNTLTDKYNMMEKLYKWKKGIVDGGGFWLVNRNGYRLSYIPFDRKLLFHVSDSSRTVIDKVIGWTPSEDFVLREKMINELLNFLCTKIMPISLLNGGQEAWDNMLITRGPGIC